MFPIIALCFAVLGVVAARGVRAAYILFVVSAVLFMLTRGGFPFHPQPCELTLTVPLILHSFRNYNHIILFTAFFVMTRAQFRPDGGVAAVAKSALLGLAMGMFVELAQALVGRGHCRLRDLFPDGAGMAIGAAITIIWARTRAPRLGAADEPDPVG